MCLSNDYSLGWCNETHSSSLLFSPLVGYLATKFLPPSNGIIPITEGFLHNSELGYI